MQIYNSHTKQKHEFKPRVSGKINIYVCGMTVYDYCHAGHARMLVAFDVITRYLRHRGYDVTYVRNITDIDDKIIARAKENNEAVTNLTDRFINAMHEDEKALGILPPDIEPRATESIEAIIKMIGSLVDKGYAYQATNGDVYYSVNKFPDYGKLANKNVEDLLVGVRVDISSVKQEPLDFVLWKAEKPGEPSWDSPWGRGRPGWHIECSAMCKKHLGQHIDIHGGGIDLVFPHHQNEIAQSIAANESEFVNTWMHVGHLQINQEKMSKSLGNFFTIRDVIKKYPPPVVRYFLMSSHYRSPLDFSDQALDNAKNALDRLYTTLRGLPEAKVPRCDDTSYAQRFTEVMDDDFNTPQALAILFELASTINRYKDKNDLQKAAVYGQELKFLADILGIMSLSLDEFFHGSSADADKQAIENLITAREQARAVKDWVRADELRAQLDQLNIILEDTPQGTIWRKG